ncbi:hypothetical protein DN069_01030 [Streptacidiphilus pinicola]|uniref:Colicin D immunity protein domain-containing protein n=1 Tax=Streptacidiphilus pinicola TaxID=2219663 RepID=A0A2X0IVI8_9ACTN|nr:hypothetical protein [Streptacidiphilus pinicola]RAG87451.1 hypothetical protein DN069_01030 [Streptacidiphilus pinicola]
MIEFTFSVREDQGSPHQFDLGDVFVRGGDGVATSEGHVPDQAMMIHVAVADLLAQLRQAYAARRGRFEFVGCDSSFQLLFVVRGMDITARTSEAELGTVRRLELMRSALRAARAFAGTETARLDPDDGASRDLHDELRRFEALLPGPPPPPPGVAEQLRLMRELDAGWISVPAFGHAWWRARDAGEHVREPLQGVLDAVFWALEEYPLDPALREPGDSKDEDVIATVRAALRKAAQQ